MIDAISGGSEKGRTQPPPDEPEGAPRGAVNAAGHGSATGGAVHCWGGTTGTGSVVVVYHQSHASSLDATVA